MSLALPRLEPVACLRSGLCVALCPTHCLEMRGQTPWLPRPTDCVQCTICVLVCPGHALELKPMENDRGSPGMPDEPPK